MVAHGPADRIRIIDGFVGIIDEFIRTIDLLLENKKIAFKKSLIGQGLDATWLWVKGRSVRLELKGTCVTMV